MALDSLSGAVLMRLHVVGDIGLLGKGMKGMGKVGNMHYRRPVASVIHVYQELNPCAVGPPGLGVDSALIGGFRRPGGCAPRTRCGGSWRAGAARSRRSVGRRARALCVPGRAARMRRGVAGRLPCQGARSAEVTPR